MSINALTKSGFIIPPVVFGTSGLGNLFVTLDDQVKRDIIKEIFNNSEGPVVFDSAGKYGAGLALESLGKCLNELGVSKDKVIISNKLGWKRIELTTTEPTFEPGVWKDLKYDAEQAISYDGIIECFDQGNELLGNYLPQLASVHDPDEYLAKANNKEEENKYYNDILEAYRALAELKREGKVAAIGVGAKNWKAIEMISRDVQLDWVMFANSMTIHNHPKELIDFMKKLKKEDVYIINSAVFHSGFLIGGSYYDYKLISPDSEKNRQIFKWREGFFTICKEFSITPAHACIQFGLKMPGVKSIALNTTNPERVKENIFMAYNQIPGDFWGAMSRKKLIREEIVDLLLK